MNGNSLLGGGAVSPNPGPSWRAIATGDFNGGGSDILFQNTTGQASVWEMNGNSLIGGGAVSANPGASWRAVARLTRGPDRFPFGFRPERTRLQLFRSADAVGASRGT